MILVFIVNDLISRRIKYF